MSEEYKKTCRYLNFVEHLLILASTITSCISISVCASLVCVPVGIMSSLVVIKLCEITAEIQNYKPIIKKKRRSMIKTVLLWKVKLNAIGVLISKALINSYLSHDKIVSVNNVLREYNEIEKK